MKPNHQQNCDRGCNLPATTFVNDEWLCAECSDQMELNSNEKIQEDLTITLSVPQTWKNAAWYEGKQIDITWVQGKIEEALSYMEEVCGISLNRQGEEFRTAITNFRKKESEFEQARRKKVEDPIYRQAQHELLTQDDLPKIRELVENIGRTTAEALRERVKMAMA